MAALGLGYDVLSARNPSLVMLSSCVMGQTGPYRQFAGFGNMAASIAGFFDITGWADRGPAGPYLAYTDYATSQRQVLVRPGALDCDLWEAARRAFALAQTRTVAVRALGVVVDRFLEADVQMDLFGGEEAVGGGR